MRRRVHAAIATTVTVLMVAGLATWWVTNTPETQAQTSCKDSGPPESYDLSVYHVDGNLKVDYQIAGKLHRSVMGSGTETIYDGQDTQYIRLPGWKLYREEKSTPPHYLDISTGEFPHGRDTLCPDAAELGAEYQGTDGIGKRFLIDSEKEWDDLTYWTDENGWVVQVETFEPFHVRMTISGIGEHNKIQIPEPPYWKWGDPLP